METGTGVMLPQLEERQELPELKEVRKGPPLEPLEEAWPANSLAFGFLASRTARE